MFSKDTVHIVHMHAYYTLSPQGKDLFYFDSTFLLAKKNIVHFKAKSFQRKERVCTSLEDLRKNRILLYDH